MTYLRYLPDDIILTNIIQYIINYDVFRIINKKYNKLLPNKSINTIKLDSINKIIELCKNKKCKYFRIKSNNLYSYHYINNFHYCIQKKNFNTYLLHYYLTTIDDITFRITFINSTDRLHDKIYISHIPPKINYLKFNKIINYNLDSIHDKEDYIYYSTFIPEILDY